LGDREHLVHHWENARASREDFLRHPGRELASYTQTDPEIVQSWQRSHAHGLNPDIKEAQVFLECEHLAEILEKNAALLDVTKRTFSALKLKDSLTNDYALYLFDGNSVLLHAEGHEVALTSAARPGTVWSEEVLGTSAHALSINLRKPFTIVGHEHYCTVFHNSIVSAAPILSKNGHVLAAVVLSIHLSDPPRDIFYASHTLGLTTAMAVAVESRLHLERSYDRIKAAQHLLKTTMAFIDEGIVALDAQGYIIHANKEALRLMPGKDNPQNRHCSYYFGHRTVEAVQSGENLDLEDNLAEGDGQVFLKIRQVSGEKMGGAVLSFAPVEKINLMAATRSGGLASFTFRDICGQSEAIRRAVDLGQRFATAAENVLLIGESGTGKELFAQAIHNVCRPAGPFMAVNCAALPRELVESELFGYEGGSFTGAERSGRPGKIELAHGGTLFLDEIGDMPLELQVVLLRVLEDKQVMRVGGNRYKKVDFRLIAATNKDLAVLVQDNAFRADLYYRLSILSINLPPLREREGDAAFFIKFFLEKYCRKLKRQPPAITPQALKILTSYHWPGNVRQLESAVIYAVNIASGTVLGEKDLPAYLLSHTSAAGIPCIASTPWKKS
jgi:transcriptional regulator of acetoin/glycerol metabolism